MPAAIRPMRSPSRARPSSPASTIDGRAEHGRGDLVVPHRVEPEQRHRAQVGHVHRGVAGGGLDVADGGDHLPDLAGRERDGLLAPEQVAERLDVALAVGEEVGALVVVDGVAAELLGRSGVDEHQAHAEAEDGEQQEARGEAVPARSGPGHGVDDRRRSTPCNRPWVAPWAGGRNTGRSPARAATSANGGADPSAKTLLDPAHHPLAAGPAHHAGDHAAVLEHVELLAGVELPGVAVAPQDRAAAATSALRGGGRRRAGSAGRCPRGRGWAVRGSSRPGTAARRCRSATGRAWPARPGQPYSGLAAGMTLEE